MTAAPVPQSAGTENARPEVVPAEAFQALGTMHQLTLESFLCQSRQELIFRMLNRSAMVAPYGRAVLWQFENGSPKCLGVSGRAEINTRTPLMQNYAELVRHLTTCDEATLLTKEHFAEAADTWRTLIEGDCANMTFLWLPLVVDGSVVAGLWLERWPGTPPWEEREVRLLSSLMVAYSAAWNKLVLQRTWWETTRDSLTRSRLLAVAAVLLAVLFIGRAQLRIVAPCEVIPENPYVMAAPLEGVIKEISVRSGQAVKTGDVLFVYDDTEVSRDLEIARQQVKIIGEQLKRAQVKAFQDPDARSTILQLQKRLKQERIRAGLAQTRMKKLVVASEISGIVLIDNPHEWKGRRVTIGERVLSVVDPDKTRLSIWLPEKDNIDFDPQAPVQVFLSSAPHITLDAELEYVAKHITRTAEGVPSFRAEAGWEDTKDLEMRIGLTGTAFLYGERVSLAYWLARKPLAAVRQRLGY